MSLDAFDVSAWSTDEPSAMSSTSGNPGRVLRYVSALQKGGAYGIFVFWCAICGFGVWAAPGFLGSITGDTFDLPDGAPGLVAYGYLQTVAPWKTRVDTLVWTVAPRDRGAEGAEAVERSLSEFADQFDSFIQNMAAADPPQLRAVRVETPWRTTQAIEVGGLGFDKTGVHAADWQPYATSDGHSVNSSVACPDGVCRYPTACPSCLFAENRSVALFVVSALTGDPWEWKDFNTPHDAFVKQHASAFDIRFSSDGAIGDRVLDNLQADLFSGDAISIPTAVVLLCFTLGSLRYAFVPILSIVGSSLGAILIMAPIAEGSTVSNVSPNMIMVLSISLAVDYNVFLFARWREEIQQSPSVEAALVQVILNAGHTIFVSGMTLLLCCWTLWLIPLNLLSSLGTAASAAVFMSVLLNLTLIPALIVVFPRYFTRATKPWANGWFGSGRRKRNRPSVSSGSNLKGNVLAFRDNDDDSDLDDVALLAMDPLGMQQPSSAPERIEIENATTRRRRSKKSHTRTIWYKFGAAVLAGHRPWIWTVTIFAACGVMVKPAVSFARTGGFLCSGPVSEKVFIDRTEIAKDFGFGRVSPYQLVALDPTGARNTSVLEAIISDELAKVNDVADAVATQYTHVPTIPCAGTALEEAACHFGRSWERGLGVPGSPIRRNMTAVVEFGLDVDEWGAAGTTWLIAAQRHFKDGCGGRYPDCQFFIAMGAAIDIDISNTVYDHFPITIGAVGGLVFVLMLIAFRSVVLAIKSVTTITITLSLVYGLAKFVYQDGIFGDGFAGTAGMGGICWIPPVLTFPILIGFGLDYHIFLLSRVVEYRKLGHSDIESVLLGLSKTGRVITYAGLIMAAGFGGLLFAHEALLSQLSFLVVVAVLVDTFLVRTILVPSMMAMLGKYNWWPRRMPELRPQSTEGGFL
jgi:hypothetical protein